MWASASLRALAVGLLLAGPAAAELAVPAEVPPPDYAGQQYVDSKGCLFMRAGPKGDETWIPRVTRDGVPLCDNPPSGQRVPVAEEAAEATANKPAANP
jgi:hypothetical protein